MDTLKRDDNRHWPVAMKREGSGRKLSNTYKKWYKWMKNISFLN
jgi:hypothetical protein